MSGSEKKFIKCLLCQQETPQTALENQFEYKHFKILEEMYQLHLEPAVLRSVETQTGEDGGVETVLSASEPEEASAPQLLAIRNGKDEHGNAQTEEGTSTDASPTEMARQLAVSAASVVGTDMLDPGSHCLINGYTEDYLIKVKLAKFVRKNDRCNLICFDHFSILLVPWYR